ARAVRPHRGDVGRPAGSHVRPWPLPPRRDPARRAERLRGGARRRIGMRTAAWRATAAEYAVLALVAAALVAAFGLTTAHFFTAATFRTIANQIPAALVLAVGTTFVLIVAGIDLSVGSVLALSGAVLGACLADRGLGLPRG